MISKNWILALLLTNGYAFAQIPTYDLKQCIELARTKSPAMQAAQLGLEINQIQINQSKTNRYASLNGSGSHTYNFGRSIDPGSNQYVNKTVQSNNFGLTSALVLFNGFQLKNAVKQSQTLLAVNQKDMEVVSNNISMSVANIYLQILLAEEQLTIYRKQREITEAQYNRAKTLFEAGNLSRSSVVNLEAQLSGDEMSIVNAQNNIRNGYAQISSLIRADSYTSFLISKPTIAIETSLIVPSLTKVLELSQSQMPEVEREKLKIQYSIHGLNISKGAYSPRLSLIASMGTVYSEARLEQYNPRVDYIYAGLVEGTNQRVSIGFDKYDLRTIKFGQQLSDNFGQSLALSMSIPIYNYGRVKNNVMISKINYETSKIELDKTLSELKNNVIQAYANWENAKAKYNASMQNETAQKTNFDFTKERFDSGLLNSVELLNAKNSWSNAQGETLQARYELVFSKLILDFYQGIPINLQ